MTALTNPAERATEAESGVELFEIHCRLTRIVLFEAKLSAGVSRHPLGIKIKLGSAVMLALEAGADLTNAYLSGAYLSGADLARADLARADLTGADLASANLAGANLAGANLANAYLSGADLARADLTGADLASANLARANLAGANLANAYLSGANLANAYLANAYLTNANLAGADLANAYLAGANLAGVRDVIAAGQPNGFWAFGYRERKTGVLRIKVGCRDKSMAEARKYWSASHTSWSERQEIPAALDMIEAVARLRGWELPQ